MVEYPWGHSRRFNAYSNYFKKQFGKRIQKVSINAGFTCPNRDGTVGTGGCTFCNNEAFTPTYCNDEVSITAQINEGVRFHESRYKNVEGFLAYFQSYSNTHDHMAELKKKYEEALSHPKVIGLVIGTRPDCVDTEKLDYFSELAKNYYIVIEYGIESVYNKTLKAINRGHSFEDAEWAVRETAMRNLHVGGHFILGLPYETEEEMIASAGIISKMPLHTVKFHQLQIIKGTTLELQYYENPNAIRLFNIVDYLHLIVRITERLSPGLILERISGEAPPSYIVTNGWGVRSDQVTQFFENKLKENDTWQGRLYAQ